MISTTDDGDGTMWEKKKKKEVPFQHLPGKEEQGELTDIKPWYIIRRRARENPNSPEQV
jgi:hypothetical protein